MGHENKRQRRGFTDESKRDAVELVSNDIASALGHAQPGGGGQYPEGDPEHADGEAEHHGLASM